MSVFTSKAVRSVVAKFAALLTVLMFALLRPFQRLMHRYSRVGDGEFFDPGKFAWVPALEENWRQIRRELDHVLQYADDIPNFQDISAENRALTDDDGWKTFFFHAWGIRVASNCIDIRLLAMRPPFAAFRRPASFSFVDAVSFGPDFPTTSARNGIVRGS